MIWMDFAENFSCSSDKEGQSPYWNVKRVSLHMMMVYFPQPHSKKMQS